jgi:N-glycosylase/DNA lyase
VEETMLINGLLLEERGNDLEVKGIKDFDPIHIFECGQCFRWNKTEDGWYSGIVGNYTTKLMFKDDILFMEGTSTEDFENFWFDYFDLGRDYSKIKDTLKKLDKNMSSAIEFGSGIRILNQPFFETLISFIISANNNIPRIKKSIDALSRKYGDDIHSSYTFPSCSELVKATVDEISECSRAGFRCKYIQKTTELYYRNPLNRESFYGMDVNNARELLMKYPGVGGKVADCVLLFTGSFQNVFPIDVWVKRVMEELYLGREATIKEISEFSAGYFGDLSGIAQQYLFYYAREHSIGQKSIIV